MAKVYVKPFAVFEVEDKAFCMRVRTLTSEEITREQYEWLQGVQGQYALDVGPCEHAWLEALRLLSAKPISAESELARDRRIWDKARSDLSLASIELMVAQACNMRCEYCYGTDGSYNAPGIMDEETAFAALDLLRRDVDKNPKVREVVIIFFGGEPLLNYDLIVRCVERAEALFHDKRLSFGMTTNLTLMTDERLAFFAAHPFGLLISFDGPREYQARRVLNDGRDSYDVTVERIGKTLKAGIDRVAARATTYKTDDRNRIIDEMERLGFHDYQLCGVSGNLGEGVVRDDLFFDYQEREARLKAGISQYGRLLTARDAQGMRTLLRDVELKVLIREACKPFAALERRLIACGSGRTMLAVSSEGDFYPCHRFVGQPEHCLGSLAAGRTLGDYAENILLENPDCRDCMARYACGGPCAHVCVCDVEPRPGLAPIFNAPVAHCTLTRSMVMLKVYAAAITTEDAMAWLRAEALL